jgi:hypothetical protein
MKKAIVKQIAAISEKMPIVMRDSYERHLVTGQDLLYSERTNVDGKPIDPKQKYFDPFPVQIAINHKRAMKKLYKKHKAAGVQGYINAVKSLPQN